MPWPTHTRFLTELDNLFLSRCTVQSPTNSVDAEGDIAEAPWNAVAGMVDLHCRISPFNLGNTTLEPMSYSLTTHIVTFAGRYAILPHWRLMVDGVAYDIEAVTGDGSGVMTRVSCRLVTK